MNIILLWRVDDDDEEDSGLLCSCAEYRIIYMYFPECTAFIFKD
jgi:hypothetical protein